MIVQRYGRAEATARTPRGAVTTSGRRGHAGPGGYRRRITDTTEHRLHEVIAGVLTDLDDLLAEVLLSTLI